MKITISPGDARVERDVPNPPAKPTWRTLPRDASLAARRRYMLDAVALNRRKRMRAIDGGKS